MKFHFDKKYTSLGITAFLVFAACLVFYSLLFHIDGLTNAISKIISILNPIIYGLIIAYILNPIMRFFETRIFFPLYEHEFRTPGWIKKRGVKKDIIKRKHTLTRKSRAVFRGVSVACTFIFAIFIIYALIAMLVPELINSITNVANSFPSYINTIRNWLEGLFKTNTTWDASTVDIFTKYSSMAQSWISGKLMPQLNSLIANMSTGVFNVLIFLKNFVLGAIIAVYLLAGKETYIARCKRVLYSFAKAPISNRILTDLRFVNEKFGGFLIGKIIDSAIIGVLCYIGMQLLHIPYSLLISVMVGVTNVIPFFGPYLGAIPSLLLILVINPIQCLYFLIFIIILQQVDGNLIGPKILGKSSGLSSFMVIVSILIAGSFLGVAGMFIAVPTCAVIVAVCQNALDKQIRKKKLPKELNVYRNLESFDENTGEPVYMDSNRKKDNELI